MDKHKCSLDDLIPIADMNIGIYFECANCGQTYLWRQLLDRIFIKELK
jgi:predicted RNA-binding Zn-ribbon protein involved in translation (DUF1610 family)